MSANDADGNWPNDGGWAPDSHARDTQFVRISPETIFTTYNPRGRARLMSELSQTEKSTLRANVVRRRSDSQRANSAGASDSCHKQKSHEADIEVPWPRNGPICPLATALPPREDGATLSGRAGPSSTMTTCQAEEQV